MYKCHTTGTVDSGGINLENGKKILNLYTKNVVNVDITELNVSLGSVKDVDKSMMSTRELFENYLN